MLRGKTNITAEEYLQFVKQVKEATLREMKSFPENEHIINGHGENSVFGVKLNSRDDKDCLYADCSFTRYVSSFTDYIHFLYAQRIENNDELGKHSYEL